MQNLNGELKEMVSLIREVALDESSIDEYLQVFETKIKEVDTSKAK